MNKRFTTFSVIGIAAILLCGCNQQDGVSSVQLDSAAETTTSATSTTEVTTAETTTAQTTTTVEKQQYMAAASDSVSAADEAAVLALCEDACDLFAQCAVQSAETDFSQLVTVDALNRYLTAGAEYYGTQLSFVEGLNFACDSLTYTDGYAIAKGTYRNDSAICGNFAFVIENINGRLYLNDMIFEAMDSYDMLYRSGLYEQPQVDFWTDPGNYDVIFDTLGIAMDPVD